MTQADAIRLYEYLLFAGETTAAYGLLSAFPNINWLLVSRLASEKTTEWAECGCYVVTNVPEWHPAFYIQHNEGCNNRYEAPWEYCSCPDDDDCYCPDNVEGVERRLARDIAKNAYRSYAHSVFHTFEQLQATLTRS